MSLRKLRTHLGILLLASTVGFTAVGCDDDKKDDTEEDEKDGDDDKKKKKKKKKGKKDDDDDKKADKKGGDKDADADKPAAAPKKIEVEPPQVDEAAKTKAKELEGKASRGRFPYDLTKEKENAFAFVHLAATSTNKELIVAALRGMNSAFTSYDKSQDRTLAEENYARAVLMKIQDPDGQIQAAAIDAAGHSVSGQTPHVKVVEALVDLAANHAKPEGRYAAIDSLGRVSELGKNKAWAAPIVAALSAKEPWLVSEALKNLRFKLYDFADKDELKPKFVELLKHADPGVRGLAAEALASLAGWDDAKRKEYAPLIEPLLDDPDNYTKSAAMSALSSLKHKPAFHKIIKFVEDNNKNTYEIRGFTQLDGESGWQHHDGSAWSTVSDAALSAIRNISHSTSKKFEYKINYKTKDADLKAAAAEAKKWYEAVKGELT